MTFIKKFLLIMLTLAAGISSTAMASLAKPESGKEYQTIASPQPTDAPGKIEVTEFFFYMCPHCNALDPYLTAWVKKQGNAIDFKRVHVDFGQGQQAFQRMYYTLEAMGKLEAIHPLIFQAIHKEHQMLRTDQDMLNFVVKQGVDKTKYQEIAKSFGIESKLRRAKALQEAYKVEDVPRVYVNGQYLTSPGQIMGANPGMTEVNAVQGMMQVLDALVVKAQKVKK